nr:adenine nucleotide translocase lysine N-methyltransferase isoform X3 [Pongo abelii]
MPSRGLAGAGCPSQRSASTSLPEAESWGCWRLDAVSSRGAAFPPAPWAPAAPREPPAGSGARTAPLQGRLPFLPRQRRAAPFPWGSSPCDRRVYPDSRRDVRSSRAGPACPLPRVASSQHRPQTAVRRADQRSRPSQAWSRTRRGRAREAAARRNPREGSRAGRSAQRNGPTARALPATSGVARRLPAGGRGHTPSPRPGCEGRGPKPGSTLGGRAARPAAMEQDDPAEALTELRERRLGALELLQAAAGSGLAAYAVWALLLQPGFRRVPLRLQVPYVGASARQVEHVLSLLRGRPGKTVDLGSGDGRIVLAAHRCGLRPAVGYELNPWLVALARLHAWRAGCAGSVCYRRKDLWKVSLRDCRNVSVFLAPSVVGPGLPAPLGSPSRTLGCLLL